MAIFLAIFLIALVFVPALRMVALFLLGALGAYIAFDNLVTEVDLGPAAFAVEEAIVSASGPDALSRAVHVQVQIANNSPVELESVDAVVTLADCSSHSAADCEPIAVQSKRVQLLAPPGVAKRTETWVYFSNLPRVRGELVASVQLVGGIGDRF